MRVRGKVQACRDGKCAVRCMQEAHAGTFGVPGILGALYSVDARSASIFRSLIVGIVYSVKRPINKLNSISLLFPGAFIASSVLSANLTRRVMLCDT